MKGATPREVSLALYLVELGFCSVHPVTLWMTCSTPGTKRSVPVGQGFQRLGSGTDYQWLNTHSLLATTYSTVAVRHAEVKDVGFLGYFLSSRTGLELAVALVGLLGPCHSPRTSETLCSLALMVPSAGWYFTRLCNQVLHPPTLSYSTVRHSVGIL